VLHIWVTENYDVFSVLIVINIENTNFTLSVSDEGYSRNASCELN